MSMKQRPERLVFLLKWGGAALAVLAIVTVIYIRFVRAPANPEISISEIRYWVLLILGLMMAFAGWLRSRKLSQ